MKPYTPSRRAFARLQCALKADEEDRRTADVAPLDAPRLTLVTVVFMMSPSNAAEDYKF